MLSSVERIFTVNPIRMKLARTLLGGTLALAGLTGLPRGGIRLRQPIRPARHIAAGRRAGG
jgi:hypothetical protein